MDRLVDTRLSRAHVELWAAAREDLHSKLGDERFNRWISPLRVISDEGEELKLGVANRYVLDWIEKQYLPQIADAVRDKFGDGIKVKLAVDPVLFREHRRECSSVLGECPDGESGPGAAASPSGGGVGTSRAASDDGKGFFVEPTLESFVVGPSNQLAYNAVLQVLMTPGGIYNPLFIHGPTGVGKTHLLKGCSKELRVRRRLRSSGAGRASSVEPPNRQGSGGSVAYLTGEQFFYQYASSAQDKTTRSFREKYRCQDVLIVDDVQFLAGKNKTQEEFLHTIRALVDSGRQVILASDVYPKALKDLDPGLIGRFLQGLVVPIKKPDFATRLGILRAQARRLSTRFQENVLCFVAEHMRGNARELTGALMKLDIHARTNGGSLGMDVAASVLADSIREEERRIDFQKIQEAVALHYGLRSEELVSRSRQRSVVFARQVAMFLARRHTRKPLAEIGKYFGNRDHATVKSGEKKIQALLADPDGSTARELDQILENMVED
jgi:chromosomal replication initiator protein